MNAIKIKYHCTVNQETARNAHYYNYAIYFNDHVAFDDLNICPANMDDCVVVHVIDQHNKYILHLV